MSDISVTYNNSEIATLNDSGTITLNTEGSYCADDITINYTSPGGGGGSSADDVIFIDYDGTVLETYSKADFLALSAMPANPTHQGLTAQGWNWTLAETKTQLNSVGAPVVIGQVYVPTDGKTHILIHTNEQRLISLNPYISPSGNSFTIDWGDGTTTTTTTSGIVNHTYASVGDYDITVEPQDDSYIMYSFFNTDLNSLTVNAQIVGIVMGTKLKLLMSTNNVFRYLPAISYIITNELNYYSGTGLRYLFDRMISPLLPCIILPRNIAWTSTNFNGWFAMDNTVSTNIGMQYISFPGDCNATYFPANAFAQQAQLLKITVPNTINSFSYGSIFNKCSKLTAINLPSTLTTIGYNAFSYMQQLDTIYLSDNITSIGYACFQYCTKLTSVRLPSQITTLSNQFFSNCESLEIVTLPANITTIGTYAFENCKRLQTVQNFPSVQVIPDYLFRNCGCLAQFIIPNTVTTIGAYAFSGCKSLQTLTIPVNVSTIGNQAFAFGQGAAISTIHIKPLVPPTLGSGVFNNVPTACIIYVPYSADHSILAAYQSATNWSTYASYMQEEPQ